MDIKKAEGFINSLNDCTVTCPECGAVHDLAEPENAQHHVSYWGGFGPQEFECGQCAAEFMVEETVLRSFEIVETPND